MNDRAIADVSFLAWAIGSKAGDIYSGGHDTAVMLKLCHDHRVTGRLLTRIRETAPGWATHEFVAELEKQQAENLRLIDMQRTVFAVIRDRYLDGGEPLLSMKGLSCYAYTRNPDHVRRTLDIDILVKEPHRVAAAMRADKVREYRNVSPHEIINARIEGVGVDLHAHYPIWSLDGDAASWQGSARDMSGRVRHKGEIRVSPLNYADLIGEAAPADVFGVEGVYVTDPSIAVLIICAHCFRDFMSFSSITVRTKPTIKFGDLAELSNFLDQPGFSAARLLDFAGRMNAGQAVRWMAHIMLRVVGDDRLLNSVTGEASPVTGFFATYPRAVWGGFFASLPDSFENLIAGKIAMSQVVGELGPVRMVAGTDNVIRIAAEPHESRSAGNTHVLAAPNGPAPVAISIRKDDGDIAVEVEVETLDRGPNSRVHIDIAGYPWEWNWDRSSDHVTAKRSMHVPEPRTEFEKTETGFRLRYRLDANLLDLPENGEIPGIVGVGEFEHAPVMRAGSLLPFVIR